MLNVDKRNLNKFINILKIPFRIERGARRDQFILLEFLEPKPESKSHKEAKKRIAKKLEMEGKRVFLEKTLHINGVKFRPDICFMENNKWNIIEVEFGNDYKNNIFKNYNKISRDVNIEVINIRGHNDYMKHVERYLEVRKQIRGI